MTSALQRSRDARAVDGKVAGLSSAGCAALQLDVARIGSCSSQQIVRTGRALIWNHEVLRIARRTLDGERTGITPVQLR